MATRSRARAPRAVRQFTKIEATDAGREETEKTVADTLMAFWAENDLGFPMPYVNPGATDYDWFELWLPSGQTFRVTVRETPRRW